MHRSSDEIAVLHVDDEPDFAEMAAGHLARQDQRFNVRTARSGREGLNMLSEHEFDCIVSDFDMPGENGIEFLEAVRESYPDVPFILYTGKGSEEVASEAISADVTDYLQKESGTSQYEVLANRITNAVEQHRARDDAVQTERRLQTIAENTNDILWKFTADWDELLFINSPYEEIWGRSIDELREEPRTFLEGIHPEDRDFVTEAMAQLSAGESVDIEYRVNADEEYDRWVWVQGEPVFDQDGAVEKVVGFARDVTERKEHERKLSALHEVAEDLTGLESIQAVCERTVEASKKILAFDLSVIDLEERGMLRKAAVSEDIPPENMGDMSVEEGIAGKTYRTGESSVIGDLTSYEDANPQGPYLSLLSVAIGKHGIFQAGANSTDAFDESDLELAELLITHCESALDRIVREQVLQRQNDRLDEFAGLVSHDLQNPLTVAKGRLELAAEECESEHLQSVADAHDRMEMLIEDMLALAKAGNAVGDIEAVALPVVVEDCWSQVATGEAELVIETGATVSADRSRLRQLLENLFQNAIKHGGPAVTVTVGDMADGFYVEDDGVGIPDAERSTVFGPGYTTSEDGAGFGLSVVRDIAEAHGWTIDISSSEAGGARFEITGIEIAD